MQLPARFLVQNDKHLLLLCVLLIFEVVLAPWQFQNISKFYNLSSQKQSFDNTDSLSVYMHEGVAAL